MRLTYDNDTSLNHRFLKGSDLVLAWGVFGSSIHFHFPRKLKSIHAVETAKSLQRFNAMRDTAQLEVFDNEANAVYTSVFPIKGKYAARIPNKRR